MNPAPFPQAVWIASQMVGGARVSCPAPYFRKSFSLDQPLRSATLAITALGLYEAEINGRRVGDQMFAPGWTDYRKRVPYQVYDIADLLRPGENVLGAILGDGWYCGHVGWRARQRYGERPGLLAQLHVTLADGAAFTVATDATWKTRTGPILESDLLMGEAYDARLELGAWSEPGFEDTSWQPIIVLSDPGISLDAAVGPPVRRIGELAPADARGVPGQYRGSTHMFDLGQNFSGRVRLTVRASRGTTLILRHAEMLAPNGTIYTENLRTARATDAYTCRGDGPETWEPRFTFHGFRYVEIDGLDAAHTVEVRGIVLHSDTPPTGNFECSNVLLNQLQRNIVWGQKSNFLEAPTDCPQRDERLGWTGDAQVFVRTAAFNMDVRAFFHKWLRDMRDAQGAEGGVPPIIPDIGVMAALGLPEGGPAWSDAAVICPWTIHLCYDDRQILADHYGSMRRYMDFLREHRCKGFIRSHPEVDPWGGFGDWLALDGSGTPEGRTPKALIGTAFYAYLAHLMARIAGVLGHEADAREYADLHGEIVQAFRHRYVTPEGLVAGETQTGYVLALHFGLIPEEARGTAVGELIRQIEQAGGHLGTGFVGTPYILDVLEANGRLDVAYRLLEQETFPSWLFPVKNGATTIWERWDGWTPEKGFQDKGMNSFNHYAYGAVGAWMYRTVAGLDLDPDKPGYGHIVFRPRPGGSLTWAKARLKTPRGETAISWRLEAGVLHLDLLVPVGARATVVAPDGFAPASCSLEAGEHRVSLHARSDG